MLFGLEEVTLIGSIEVSILDDGASSHIPEIKAKSNECQRISFTAKCYRVEYAKKYKGARNIFDRKI